MSKRIEIVEEQAKIAQERERDWSRNTLVALVFAFHTVEAYPNYVGEKLAPEIWAHACDEVRLVLLGLGCLQHLEQL